MTENELIEQIRKGTLDINNQELFFSILIKGLLNRLDDDITIRGISVPHFILHTGDDTMYLNLKGLDQSKEPLEVSNENYIYNIIPRCIVNPGGIDLLPDLLTSPYSRGNILVEIENGIYNLSGEFRRMPIKFSCDIKYYLDSYRDFLETIQQIISKLSFIRTYNITYMGQVIKCSYKIPEAFSGEYAMDLDGTTTENKSRTISLSLEVETNYPVFSPRTIVSNNKIITGFQFGSHRSADMIEEKFDPSGNELPSSEVYDEHGEKKLNIPNSIDSYECTSHNSIIRKPTDPESPELPEKDYPTEVNDANFKKGSGVIIVNTNKLNK